MKLALDLDGCVVDFMGQVCRQHNADYGTTLAHADITDWNFLPLTRFTDWDDFWGWAAYWRIFADADPYEGAVEAVKGLAQAHEVTFLTHRPEWAQEDTHLWLRAHGLCGIPVVFADGEKHTHGHDLWVDDSPAVLKGLAATFKRAIRMLRPWNERVDCGQVWRTAAGCVDATAKDWGQVERLVEVAAGMR